MLKEGNGSPEVCAANLMRTAMYEVPYDRTRGIDPSHIGAPPEGGLADLAEDVRQTIEDYEPRVSASAAEAVAAGAGAGAFMLSADISRIIEESEEDEE